MLDLATESSSEGTSAKLAPEYSETSFKIIHPEVGTASLKVLQILNKSDLHRALDDAL
jgi:hypothetical protein